MLREDLKSICPFSSCSLLFPRMATTSTDFSRTHIVRDALRFRGEHAHWVDHEEKLDGVLFFHSSSLRDIMQGQARPEKYVFVPNDVTVIPTYVELRRPFYEAIPEQWRGNAERVAQWSASQGVARESSRPCTASDACCADCRFCDWTYRPCFAKFLGVPRKISSYGGKYSREKFIEEPAYELWELQNVELFRILFHVCKNAAHGLLQQLRPVDGSGARGNGQEALNFLRNKCEGRLEARVRSLLAEMQSCTLQLGEDPDVYFARLYRTRLQMRHVGCTVDNYQRRVNALS